jgi:hypothetical protein
LPTVFLVRHDSSLNFLLSSCLRPRSRSSSSQRTSQQPQTRCKHPDLVAAARHCNCVFFDGVRRRLPQSNARCRRISCLRSLLGPAILHMMAAPGLVVSPTTLPPLVQGSLQGEIEVRLRADIPLSTEAGAGENGLQPIQLELKWWGSPGNGQLLVLDPRPSTSQTKRATVGGSSAPSAQGGILASATSGYSASPWSSVIFPLHADAAAAGAYLRDAVSPWITQIASEVVPARNSFRSFLLLSLSFDVAEGIANNDATSCASWRSATCPWDCDSHPGRFRSSSGFVRADTTSGHRGNTSGPHCRQYRR